MRNGLLIGAVAGLGAIMAVACGSSSTAPDETLPSVEGGTSGTSGTSGLPGTSGSSGGEGGTSGGLDGGGSEGGDGGGGVMPTTLKSGTVILVGVTSDGYAAYIAISGMTATLEVVPVAGGAPTVLVPAFAQTDGVTVSGASVAYWTGVSTAGIGTLGYWTKATGVMAAVSTTSKSGMFYSSADSSRIAFSVAATAVAAAPKSTDLAVTSAAAAVATPVITGNNAVNVAAATPASAGAAAACPPDIGFVGKILFAAYCTGTTATTKAGRLVAVADASTTAARLDTASPTSTAAATIQPFRSVDTTGTKIFVIDAANSRGRLIFNAATRTEANLENDTQDGLMLADGSGVVYRVQNTAGTTKAIRHATAVASPAITDLVPTSAEGLLSVSLDQKHALYHSLAAAAGGLVDIHSLGTAPPPATAAIVATATAFPFGFTGDNTTVLYQTDVDANGIGKLKAQPVAGGPEKLIASNMFDARPLAAGTRMLVLDNPKTDMTTMLTSVDLKLADSAGAAAPVLLADTVQANGFDVSGTHLVFTRLATGATGLYSIPLP
jgi:hypothetical protein